MKCTNVPMDNSRTVRLRNISYNTQETMNNYLADRRRIWKARMSKVFKISDSESEDSENIWPPKRIKQRKSESSPESDKLFAVYQSPRKQSVRNFPEFQSPISKASKVGKTKRRKRKDIQDAGRKTESSSESDQIFDIKRSPKRKRVIIAPKLESSVLKPLQVRKVRGKRKRSFQDIEDLADNSEELPISKGNVSRTYEAPNKGVKIFPSARQSVNCNITMDPEMRKTTSDLLWNEFLKNQQNNVDDHRKHRTHANCDRLECKIVDYLNISQRPVAVSHHQKIKQENPGKRDQKRKTKSKHSAVDVSADPLDVYSFSELQDDNPGKSGNICGQMSFSEFRKTQKIEKQHSVNSSTITAKSAELRVHFEEKIRDPMQRTDKVSLKSFETRPGVTSLETPAEQEALSSSSLVSVGSREYPLDVDKNSPNQRDTLALNSWKDSSLITGDFNLIISEEKDESSKKPNVINKKGAAPSKIRILNLKTQSAIENKTITKPSKLQDGEGGKKPQKVLSTSKLKLFQTPEEESESLKYSDALNKNRIVSSEKQTSDLVSNRIIEEKSINSTQKPQESEKSSKDQQVLEISPQELKRINRTRKYAQRVKKLAESRMNCEEATINPEKKSKKSINTIEPQNREYKKSVSFVRISPKSELPVAKKPRITSVQAITQMRLQKDSGCWRFIPDRI